MNPPDPRQTVALFRYGLIAEFVHLPPNSPGLYAKLRQKAEQSYAIPGSTRTRVALETLRDWLKRYRRGGFDAFARRRAPIAAAPALWRPRWPIA